MIRRKIPDFGAEFGWYMQREYDLQSEYDGVVGRCVLYIHEQTGNLGMNLFVRDIPDRIICWEEKLRFSGREKSLYYIAYLEKDAWRKLRTEKLYPERVSVEKLPGETRIAVYFSLTVNQEQLIIFRIQN